MAEDAVYAGIDIGGTTVKLGCVCSDGSLLRQSSIPTVKGNAQILAERIKEEINSFGIPIRAAGCSCAGRVNHITGTVIASNLQWNGEPFAAVLERALGVPTHVDNDVAGALRGECAIGACKGEKNVVYLSIGTGIGGAFLMDGKPFRGYNNTGGEVGHMITHGDGIPCACGGHGCFEQYASASALSRMAGGAAVPEVFARAEAGDARMCEVLDAYTHELAIGLSGLIAIFRPQVLVIGGGVSEAGDSFLRRVRVHVYEKCPSTPAQEKPDIRLAQLGNMAGVIGGAMLAMSALK